MLSMPKRKAVAVEEDIAENEVVVPNSAESMSIFRTPLSKSYQSLEKCIKIISWNVAGIRGTLKNKPSVFTELVQKYDPEVICLQETKLQESHVSDISESILPGYQKFWCCSNAKKGYSGTAVFVKGVVSTSVDSSTKSTKTKKQSKLDAMWGNKSKKDEAPPKIVEEGQLVVKSVQYEFNEAAHSGEGRTITVEFDSFYLVNCYVPNSGQNLERLEYRTSEWDTHLHNYLQTLERSKPVILAGDLNVAYADIDFYNPTAKHIHKQAGLTPQERQSFGALLNTDFHDALRYFYPDAVGQYTYWSMRTQARGPNKGLRLDYFMCSKSLFGGNELKVVDTDILHEDTVGCSDHCPILLALK